ncbi:hypothetical protein CKO45_30375, partial [Paracraurococcus ruber]|nr:hypothetical protein [Paracraurococcus ruber]
VATAQVPPRPGAAGRHSRHAHLARTDPPPAASRPSARRRPGRPGPPPVAGRIDDHLSRTAPRA